MSDIKIIAKSAVISDCGKYRYRLYREWEKTDRMPVLWVMLNPSTADADIDDPTINRCVAFSHSWGYGAMLVGNLYAYRSTDPEVLKTISADEAIGPENIHYMRKMLEESAIAVCGWGNPGGKFVPAWLKSHGGLWCLARNKHGSPKHPLYVKGETPLISYS